MTVKVKATMLAIVTADLYVDNMGYDNTTLIQASEYARSRWTPELEEEAERSIISFRQVSGEQYHMSDANILTFGCQDLQAIVSQDYPLLDAYLEECFERGFA